MGIGIGVAIGFFQFYSRLAISDKPRDCEDDKEDFQFYSRLAGSTTVTNPIGSFNFQFYSRLAS